MHIGWKRVCRTRTLHVPQTSAVRQVRAADAATVLDADVRGHFGQLRSFGVAIIPVRLPGHIHYQPRVLAVAKVRLERVAPIPNLPRQQIIVPLRFSVPCLTQRQLRPRREGTFDKIAMLHPRRPSTRKFHHKLEHILASATHVFCEKCTFLILRCERD